MKAELGLRSPVNTLVRHLNPLKAKTTIQGMFHPAYMPLHHDTAVQLGQTNNIVLKGDGGEFEVRPDSDTAVSINATNLTELTAIPPVLAARAIRPEKVSLQPLIDLWNQAAANDYGEQAVIETATLILAVHRHTSLQEARQQVVHWWNNRKSLQI